MFGIVHTSKSPCSRRNRIGCARSLQFVISMLFSQLYTCFFVACIPCTKSDIRQPLHDRLRNFGTPGYVLYTQRPMFHILQDLTFLFSAFEWSVFWSLFYRCWVQISVLSRHGRSLWFENALYIYTIYIYAVISTQLNLGENVKGEIILNLIYLINLIFNRFQ